MLVSGENMIYTYDMLKKSLKKYKAVDMKIKRMIDRQEVVRLTRNLYETDIKTPGYLVANAIYSPSYLSFDYALAYYDLIPERVVEYTCATYKKRKHKTYTNLLGRFSYRDVPSKVFPLGQTIYYEGEYAYVIATPEKALCDKLYITKAVTSKKEMRYLLFSDLRIEEEDFQNLNFDDLKLLCRLYESTNMKYLRKVLKDYENCNRGND